MPESRSSYTAGTDGYMIFIRWAQSTLQGSSLIRGYGSEKPFDWLSMKERKGYRGSNQPCDLHLCTEFSDQHQQYAIVTGFLHRSANLH
jgi:hypothetical protein